MNPSGSPVIICRITSALGLVTYRWENNVCNACLAEYFKNDSITCWFARNEIRYATGRFMSCTGCTYNVDCFYRDDDGVFFLHGTCIINSNCAVCARINISNPPIIYTMFTMPYTR